MLHYREATTSDLPMLYQLEQELIAAERPMNGAIKETNVHYYDIAAFIEDEHTCLLVAELKGQLVATGYVQIRPSKAAFKHTYHGYLGFIFVTPHCRGQGISQAIITRLMTWGRSKGINDYYLDVYADNKAAIGAYKKLGFNACLIEMKLHEPVKAK